MNSRDDAFMVLLALAIEALKWAVVIGAFLLVLYFLVRFVKWAWTDKPEPKENPTAERSYERYATERLHKIAAVDLQIPLTEEQWGEWIDIASGHDKTGRPICLLCGVPIPEGKSVLLADDERKALARRRGVKVKDLPGAFRHIDEAECGVTQGPA